MRSAGFKTDSLGWMLSHLLTKIVSVEGVSRSACDFNASCDVFGVDARDATGDRPLDFFIRCFLIDCLVIYFKFLFLPAFKSVLSPGENSSLSRSDGGAAGG
jgi:hypothetical protein